MSEGPSKKDDEVRRNNAERLAPILENLRAAEAEAKAKVGKAAQRSTTTAETTSATESHTEKKDPLDMPTTPQEVAENPVDVPISPESGGLGEPETISESEHTPKEWREKLRGLITSAKEKLGMSERGERLTSYLKDRSAKLDAGAGELGMVEKSFRALGERYNKLGWKSKLGVGLALGVGSAAFSGVSLPIAFACTSGLALQRVAGMASVFLKYEKKGKALGKEGGLLAQKEKAMLKAMLYSAGMSLAIGEAVSLASESSYGEAVHEWLKQNWPSGGSGVQTDIPESPEESLSTETPAPTSEMPPTDTAETPSTEPEPEAPQPETVPSTDTSSSAVPIQEDAPAGPDTEPTGSPEVASADTESAKLAAKEFGAEYAEPETVPEDLSAQEWRAEYAEPGHHTGAPDWRAEHTEADFAPEVQAETSPPAEAALQAPITEEVVTAPDAVPADTLSATPETPPVATPEANHFVVNTHGLSIDEAHASAYLDTQGNHIIYGGSLDDRAEIAKQLVAKNHSAVVYFDSTRAGGFLGLQQVPHVSQTSWVEAGSESGIKIVEDTNDAALQGTNLPSINDLAQVYKPEAGIDVTQLRPAEMPITAPSPDDIPRADMPPANTEDEFSRPEMQVDKQNIPSGPEINPHPLARVEVGSIKGEFGYSPDGTVTSLNTAGIAHGEFKTLLNDNYGEVLVNRPGGNVGLARSVVENRARDIFNRMQVLDELAKRGASGSPEADFIRRSIKFTVEQTENAYGNVFKDILR